MRSKLLRLSRLVAYARNFNAFAQNAKLYSTKGPNPTSSTQMVSTEIEAPLKKQIDREILLLGPKDFRAPLPGNVGVAQSYLSPTLYVNTSKPQNEKKNSDLFESELPRDRHRNVLAMLLSEEQYTEAGLVTSALTEVLECVAQDCPILVKKDLQDLFPSRDLTYDPLTVITLCQKTENDMSAWNHETDAEREELLSCFVTAASEICDTLKNEGYWADFIDPSSGRPFLGPYTNATMFETDDRYRHFGLVIEDLGCCKVISHHLFGTHAFLGSIFTNAALESPQVQAMLKRNQTS